MIGRPVLDPRTGVPGFLVFVVIDKLLRKLLQQKGGDREEAEKAIEQDMKYIGTGKKGWSYVSAGEIDYMEGLLKGS